MIVVQKYFFCKNMWYFFFWPLVWTQHCQL